MKTLANLFVMGITSMLVATSTVAAFGTQSARQHDTSMTWGVSPSTSAFGSSTTTQKDGYRREPFAILRPTNSKSSSQLQMAAGDTPSDPVRIIIAGAPASGKGTQCEKIKEKFGLVHLSTGDMLRAAVAAGTDVGKKAKEFMDSGKLVPDEVIIGVVSSKYHVERLAKQLDELILIAHVVFFFFCRSRIVSPRATARNKVGCWMAFHEPKRKHRPWQSLELQPIASCF